MLIILINQSIMNDNGSWLMEHDCELDVRHGLATPWPMGLDPTCQGSWSLSPGLPSGPAPIGHASYVGKIGIYCKKILWGLQGIFTQTFKFWRGQKLQRIMLLHNGLGIFNLHFLEFQFVPLPWFLEFVEMSMTPKPIILDSDYTKLLNITQGKWVIILQILVFEISEFQ